MYKTSKSFINTIIKSTYYNKYNFEIAKKKCYYNKYYTFIYQQLFFAYDLIH